MKAKKMIFIAALLIISMPFALFAQNYSDALSKAIQFYDANKCGPDVASNNVFSWRGACHTQDGNDVGVNLNGGFHDAGDHVKFGLPQGYTAAVLGWALYEFRSAFDSAGVTNKLLSTLKYFTDYFIRSKSGSRFYYQVGPIPENLRHVSLVKHRPHSP
jgi:endoglucanase